MKKILLLLICMFPFLVGSQEPFSSFVLSLYWPNGYCTEDGVVCREPVPQRFTINGFEPRTYDGKFPTFKNKNHFRYNEERNWNFSSDLRTFWPSLLRDAKIKAFWDKRWFKSGAHTDMTAEDYFYTAIEYARKYLNLYELLKQSELEVPSNQPYKSDILHQEIARIVGSSPSLRCNRRNDEQHQLMGVTICMNREGEVLDCPNPFYHCSIRGTMIYFPTNENSSHV